MKHGARSLSMSSMDRNLQSHPKFKAKFIRDLKELYDKKKHADYIERFRQFKKINTPDDILVVYYYETLIAKKLYYYVVDYALERMHAGVGDYEDNMSYMLRAMMLEERYDEVIDFTKHLMNETIPHRFRMFIQEIRQDAIAAMDEKHRNRYRRKIVDEVDLISKEEFLGMPHALRLNFLQQITEKKRAGHREMVRACITDNIDNTIKTVMLLFLNAIEDDEEIAVPKGDQIKNVVPKDLPKLEHTRLGGKILKGVKREIESDSPDLIEHAESVIIGVLMQLYPMEPPYDDARMIKGFKNYIYHIVNLPNTYEEDKSVKIWIEDHL